MESYLNNLLLQCIKLESNNSTFTFEDQKSFSFLNCTNINNMNTYNAIRYLYRKEYDLRSEEKKDIDPFTSVPYKINYLNDFSISPVYNFKDNDYIKNIATEYLKGRYAFTNKQIHKFSAMDRIKSFCMIESAKANNNYTTDFFSYNIQVNPLLYSYMDIDPKDGTTHIMDSDLSLEMNRYNEVFNNESYLMKGNQCCNLEWFNITDTSSTQKKIYDKDSDEYLGFETTYQNEYWLLKDDYTHKLLHLLENPSNYYQFNNQNDFVKEINQNNIKTEEETRGHLLYDDLLKIVLKRMKDHIDHDSSKPDNIDACYTKLENLLLNDEIRNGMEFSGISIDQYLVQNLNDIYKIQGKDMIDSFIRTQLKDYIVNLYKYNYNVVFGHLFRLLPFIMSPAYKYKIQSPAMNIMFMTFTLMAIKNAYYHDKESYELIINSLYELSNSISSMDEKDLLLKFESIFNDDFLKKNLEKHIDIVLKALILNTSAINFDNTKDPDSIYTYMTEKIYSYVENNKNIEKNDVLNKSIILLTEFFYKMEKLRYFDLSTFSIDYTLLTNKAERNSLKLFADSLLEACYIHLNTLGSEIFFNGMAPSHMRTAENNYSNHLNLIGLDCTRAAKNNVSLINSIIKNNSSFYHNSYNSYIPIINLYTSLVYCIHITLDNLSINNYNVGPYTQDNIKRPQSLWAISKRYAIHLMYINNNSYGIWNDVNIDVNNKDNIHKMMIAHRLKFLTYGLHLKYWFNDGYFFYTNYKKLAINYNGDFKNIIKSINELYHSNPDKILKLFSDSDYIVWIPVPNIGLSLAPMAGSYSIMTMINCISHYIDDKNEMIVNLIHHGLKDIMVGDSMSCIIEDRYDCIKRLLSNKNISLNNINRNFQLLFDDLNTSKYHEIALSANLSFIYKNIIKKHFINNLNDCMALNSTSVNANYDESFFNKEDEISSYNISYNNHSWGYRIFNSILKVPNKNDYMKLINNYITLYRVSIVNFKTWHADCEEDEKLNTYYKKFNGFSNMLSLFRKDYKTGLDRMVRNKHDYGIFDKITHKIFTQNKYNNNHSIDNIFSVTFNKNSFEDNIVNLTAGGTVYGMYESPSALMIYNNVNFDQINNYINPTEENLFMLGRDLLLKVYLIIKRLIVDLNFNGEPFERLLDYYPDKTLDEVKDIFINNCIEQFYIITNNRHNKDLSIQYNKILDKGDIAKFVSIVAQFFDYDYVSKQVCQLLDNQYDLNDEGAVKYLNSSLSNRKNDVLLYKSYCELISSVDNQLNFVINTIIKQKQGSIRKIDSSINFTQKNKKSIVKNNSLNILKSKSIYSTNYPMQIDDLSGITNLNEDIKVSRYITYDSIGITEEEYNKLNKLEQEEYNKQVQESKELIEKNNIQYNEKVTNLEQQLSQLRRAKKIANNEKVYDNVEQETFTRLSKESAEVIIINKLSEICNTLSSIKEIVLDNNHLLKELYNHNDNINFEGSEVVINKNDIVGANNIQSEITINENNDDKNSVTQQSESNINEHNKIEDNNYTIENDNNIKEKEDSFNSAEVIKEEIISVPKELGVEYTEYHSPIKPVINDDESIDFFSNSGYDVRIPKDYSSEPKNINEQFEIKIRYEGVESININQLDDDYCNMEYELKDTKRVSYDKYIYAPKKYLVQLIPIIGFDCKNVQINKDDKISNKISKYKVCKYNVPIYGINAKQLLFPFENVPIIFKQSYDNIIKDINDRIAPVDDKMAQKIIKTLEDSDIKNSWDSKLSHITRFNIISILHKKIHNK